MGQHSDHAIVYLPDGWVVALGIRPDSPTVGLSMIELYDPATGTRAIGPSPTHLRARPESLLLPDGRVIAFGGEYTGNDPFSLVLTNAGTVQNVTQVADLFDPISDSWRPMSDMTRFIHYHNVSVLAPDGRVMTTAGAGSSGPFGDDDSVEAFEPPYLFRGIRPRIDSVSSTELEVGGTYSLQVSLTEQVTRVVLLGTRAVTHSLGRQRHATLLDPGILAERAYSNFHAVGRSSSVTARVLYSLRHGRRCPLSWYCPSHKGEYAGVVLEES